MFLSFKNWKFIVNGKSELEEQFENLKSNLNKKIIRKPRKIQSTLIMYSWYDELGITVKKSEGI